jgi:hypothetical protein
MMRSTFLPNQFASRTKKRAKGNSGTVSLWPRELLLTNVVPVRGELHNACTTVYESWSSAVSLEDISGMINKDQLVLVRHYIPGKELQTMRNEDI